MKYTVSMIKKVSYSGAFEITSKKKLTEDEVLEAALAKANEGEEPEDGWEETDTEYEDAEVEDGELKEEA